MNLKNSFENAKRKAKENLPVIVETAATIGSAAIVVCMVRKTSIRLDEVLFRPKRVIDFSMHISGREFDKIASGIPKKTNIRDDAGVELVVATKDMLKENFQKLLGKVIAKD